MINRNRTAVRSVRCCTLLLYEVLEPSDQDFDFASMTWVELWGFEPQTSCMPYKLRPSPHVAVCRPAWSSPAASVAVRGLASPGVAPRWLPTWLPELLSAANVRRSRHPAMPEQPPSLSPDRAGSGRGPDGMRPTRIPAASTRTRRPRGPEVRLSSPSAKQITVASIEPQWPPWASNIPARLPWAVMTGSSESRTCSAHPANWRPPPTRSLFAAPVLTFMLLSRKLPCALTTHHRAVPPGTRPRTGARFIAELADRHERPGSLPRWLERFVRLLPAPSRAGRRAPGRRSGSQRYLEASTWRCPARAGRPVRSSLCGRRLGGRPCGTGPGSRPPPRR